MRAWAVVENGAPLKELELPTPEPKGTEVLIEVTHCGVCHSDLHIWEGYYDIGGGKKMSLKDRGVVLPLAMGHEIVGRVVKLGPDAPGDKHGVKVGDLRIVFPWLGCGTCEKCLAEEDNMCLVPRSLGVYANGGYGTHVIAPHPRHLVDPGTIDPAVAATYACSGITVYSAIRKAMPIPPNEAIVVVGAGGLGLNAIAVLTALKHQNIVVVDISAEKRDAALKARAHKVVDGSGDGVTKRIVEAAGGPVLAVIDLVNGTQTARFAFDALRKGKADPGRAVRRRTHRAAAVDGDPRADGAGHLRRQSEGAARTGEACAGRGAASAAGSDGAAEPGQRRADAPARRHGDGTAGTAVGGSLSHEQHGNHPPFGRAEATPGRQPAARKLRHPRGRHSHARRRRSQ